MFRLLAVVGLLSTPASAERLDLICLGNGSKAVSSSSSSSSSYGESASSSTTRTQFNDQVNVQIIDGSGLIRIPRPMLPQIYSGSSDGWWEIRNLAISTDEITGNVSFNFMNKPRVRIDRTTGHISINGTAHFSGVCEAYDPETAPKKF
ncbi:hypothetical protein [Tardibacter chloracetimidivorans]|uniref:hypothetical protein n=1 Tax=Tardibacter chloracetimidivorans TaxID=1921510 RepID=UPI00130108E4|nr:hypothetical protein [Tardibacter chloracetimidivorans]